MSLLHIHSFDMEASSPSSPLSDATHDVDMSGGSEDDDENGSTVGTGIWTKEEHARFLEAIKIYANGPWKLVAAYVATRTVRQTMTHAQKYRQKAARRLRGLRTKQALMRMHYGHRIADESLVQERLRSLAAQVEDASSSAQPLYTPTAAAAARRAASSRRNTHRAASGESLLALLTEKTTPVSSRRTSPLSSKRTVISKTQLATEPLTGSSIPLVLPPVSPVDAGTPLPAMIGYNFMDLSPELDIMDDLSEAPSLEECAEMLYDLLCC